MSSLFLPRQVSFKIYKEHAVDHPKVLYLLDGRCTDDQHSFCPEPHMTWFIQMLNVRYLVVRHYRSRANSCPSLPHLSWWLWYKVVQASLCTLAFAAALRTVTWLVIMPHVCELFAVSIHEIKCLWIVFALDYHICSSTIRAILANRLLGGIRLCSASTAAPWWHCTTTWTSLCDELSTEPALRNSSLWLEVHWMYSMYSISVTRAMRESYIASRGWLLSRFCVSLSWVCTAQ